MYVIQSGHSMNRIENDIHTANYLSTETHKIFRYITAYGGEKFTVYFNILKCIKYNEINVGHSSVQKHVSYKKFNKEYKYYVYKLIQNFSDTLHSTEENF